MPFYKFYISFLQNQSLFVVPKKVDFPNEKSTVMLQEMAACANLYSVGAA